MQESSTETRLGVESLTLGQYSELVFDLQTQLFEITKLAPQIIVVQTLEVATRIIILVNLLCNVTDTFTDIGVDIRDKDVLGGIGLVGLEPLIEIDLDIFREYTVASVVQLTITGTWVLVREYTITSINQQVAVTVFGGHWLFVVLIGHLVVFSNPHFQDMDA